MRWKVLLEGTERGLEDLSNSFSEDPEVFEEEGRYFLWCSQFEDLSEDREVYETAKDIVQVIQSFALMESIKVDDLRPAQVHEILDDGSTNVHVFLEGQGVVLGGGRVRVIDPETGEELEEYLPANQTYEWTQLALEDEEVREMVRIIERGFSWVNMYRILEFVEKDIDDTVSNQGWWSGNERGDFKKTANRSDSIGYEARHIPNDKIKDPITHSEAKHLIQRLLRKWFQYRRK